MVRKQRVKRRKKSWVDGRNICLSSGSWFLLRRLKHQRLVLNRLWVPNLKAEHGVRWRNSPYLSLCGSSQATMVKERSASTTNLMGTITVELKLDAQQQQLLQQAAANWGFTLQEYLQELALNSIDQRIPTRDKDWVRCYSLVSPSDMKWCSRLVFQPKTLDTRPLEEKSETLIHVL